MSESERTHVAGVETQPDTSGLAETVSEPFRDKATATDDWIGRVFRTRGDWALSLRRTNRWRFVSKSRPRKPVIHIRLLPDDAPAFKLPCPASIPAEIAAAVCQAVTGRGPRPRIEYEHNGQRRIAIGRKGEHPDRLRAELVQHYGLVWMAELQERDGPVAEYVATGGSYRPFARAAGERDQQFLARAATPSEVERETILSDRQLERVWRLHPVYIYDGDGDPGEWAQEKPKEVSIGDTGGQAEMPAPLPAAIPKADGRGKHGLYFGYALNYGGGCRWSEEDFFPPLDIALGGELNRSLGFGNSTGTDEVIPYVGDGFHWGPNNPLPKREPLDRNIGPVCRVLLHPEPDGAQAKIIPNREAKQSIREPHSEGQDTCAAERKAA